MATLARSRAEFRRLLERQIERGQALRQGAQEVSDGNELSEFKAERRSFQEFNRALLEQSFNEPAKFVGDYNLSCFVSGPMRGGIGQQAPSFQELRAECQRGLDQELRYLHSLLEQLELFEGPDPPQPGETTAALGTRILIGHGRSEVWRRLKDYLESRLGLEVDEYSRITTAGLSRKERLTQMLDGCNFAFLVLTAEDERADGTMTARMNVVHEVGLAQGRYGFERAIVLLEHGCEEFSNIEGIEQIRFPARDISARFHEVHGVLEREGAVRSGTGER